jgi:hypothetical protein
MRKLILGVLLLLPACPASTQSLYGPGGLFLHPTATLPEKGQVTPGFLLLPQHNPVAKSTRTWISASLDYGLTDRIEVGAVFLKVAGWQRDPSAGGFFKYQLVKEGITVPAAAIGFTQLGGGDVNTRSAFLALRKQFGVGGKLRLIGHVGVEYADEVDGIARHEFRPYAGAELEVGKRLSFIVEGRPRMNREFGTPIALTIAYKPSSNWRLAITWANNGLSDEPKFGFGAGLTLGSR